MGFSNAVADEILNERYRTPSVWLALYTNDPTSNDTGTEVSGGGYQRIEIDFTAPITEAGKRTIKIDAEVQSAVATANWGTITHFGIRTAATGGTLISSEALQEPKTINTGERFTILLGDGVIRLR
jgi:hypothetical protein